MRLNPPQLSKNGCDIDYDALALGPGCVVVKINIFGSFLGGHAYLIAFLGLLIDVLEIPFYLRHTLLIGKGAMSWYDGIHIHLKNAITGPQPVAGWPGPDDGMASDEQDIGCEDDPVSRDVDKGVAKSVSRPNLYKMHFLVSHFQC